MKRTYAAVLITMFVCAVSTVLADSVTTSDGSTLVGKIVRLYGGKLTIETKIAGLLEIDATEIVKIVTDEPMNVAFSTGDKLVGHMTPSGDGSMMKSALGEISVDATKVTSMWAVGEEDPVVLAVREETNAEIERLKPVWTFDVEAGGVMTEGNTETLVAHGRLDVKRKTTEDLLHFYLTAQYTEQNKLRTVNEYRGGIRFRQDLAERWYWYTRLELEFDEFEGLDLRTTVAVGGGYFWLKEEHHELATSVGLGYRNESYTSGRTVNDAVLDLTLDYRLDFLPWGQFTHQTVYLPDFQDYGNYRLDVDNALVVPFANDRWKWKMGIRHEYNSRPQRGLERLDNTYYTSMVVSLK